MTGRAGRSMIGQRIVLVPGVPALLPQYASLVDPIPALRAACRESLAWLAELDVPISVHCARGSWRLAEHLIAEAGAVNDHRMQPAKDDLSAVLVIGNGSACRTEKAPGFLDHRAEAFDSALGAALGLPDPAALADLDPALSQELLADTESLRWLGEVLTPAHRSEMRYDDDPFGVQYWVMRWELAGD